ncbi:hypothetical protein HN014_10695 [Aquimarina sp. TRL1]|uniref:hypothetical protein n=1 Tax=Aquimarina sp. (strain TRL1) TaxID=2736252 RepID=UPI00158A38BE|nr:hypothetical protein [Aquimarina sp. TRL1]QKX05362.1 hypothetical protein HN014_10695 [Aquimarina sp. TRL1]
MKTINKQRHRKFAQNSIAYIVYNNPDAVRKLIHHSGYIPPSDIHELVSATKELVRLQGKDTIARLLRIHPDKKAILSLSDTSTSKKGSCHFCNYDHFNSEDNYCGFCGHSNYTGLVDKDRFLQQFADTSDGVLEKYYHQIVNKSNKQPENQTLASEVQLVWNELRQRRLHQAKQSDRSSTKESLSFNREEILFMGLSFIGGFVVCSILKR